jgi:hypothetical protein
MNVGRSRFVGLLVLGLLVAGTGLAVAATGGTGRSAIFGGGPFYSGGQAVMDDLRGSGFTTVMLWSIHVDAGSGDLSYNDTRIVSNGQYIGDPGWPARLRTLKQAPTSVNRIEVSVGSAGPDDWSAIDGLLRSQGSGPGSILYRNFQALQNATGADAVDDDDEAHYDQNSTTTFARMVLGLGYRHFTFAPFTNSGFWAGVRANLGSAVDRVYLQDYAGGSGNDPGAWSRTLGLTVDPGLWSRNGPGCSGGDDPASVRQRMAAWHASAGIQGGFMWLYDDIQRCAGLGTAAAYANAINTATGSGGGSGHTGAITGIAGKCVDVRYSGTASGTPIQLYTCNGTAAQRWTVNSDGSLGALGKCLDITQGGTAAGTRVQLWDCNGTGAQRWQARDGTLVNPQSGRCLDDPYSSTADGTQLQIWDCNGTAAQRWNLP